MSPRRGLVLGAGGVLGFAWMAGALAALEQTLGWAPADAEIMIGTSAGSVTAALLGAGVETRALVNGVLGVRGPGDPVIDYDAEHSTGGSLPLRPRLRIGSTALVARSVAHPRRFPPLAALSAWLPHGRGTLAPIKGIIEEFVPAGEWAPRTGVWIVAMDYDRGRRVAFGRPGAPAAGLSEAVVASCSIPGWYESPEIGGRRYVDGGTCSPTSLDLLAGQDLDEVVVLAPMASFEVDRPTSVVGRLERRFRRAMTKRITREAAKVRSGGTKVTILTPGPEDLEAIGVNLMDPRRRLAVLETSLRTSAAALARHSDLPVAG